MGKQQNARHTPRADEGGAAETRVRRRVQMRRHRLQRRRQRTHVREGRSTAAAALALSAATPAAAAASLRLLLRGLLLALGGTSSEFRVRGFGSSSSASAATTRRSEERSRVMRGRGDAGAHRREGRSGHQQHLRLAGLARIDGITRVTAVKA